MVTLVLFKDIEKVDLKITDNSKISSDCKEFITVKKKKNPKNLYSKTTTLFSSYSSLPF